MRAVTETEALRNLLFRHNGTPIPGINPKRLGSHPSLRNRLRALHINRRLYLRRPLGV